MPEISHEIGVERESAHLLKTGQTTQYGGYEDDGYFEKGLSQQYDILTAGQYAGTTNITLNAKTDAHSNNCVYDKRTKLMWSRYLVGTLGPNNNGTIPWTTNVNGEGIYAFIAAANAALLGGYSDWRIPNAIELASLQDMEAPTAIPNATAFPTWVASYVWSSTTAPSATTYASGLGFSGGDRGNLDKTTNRYCALVRGG